MLLLLLLLLLLVVVVLLLLLPAAATAAAACCCCCSLTLSLSPFGSPAILFSLHQQTQSASEQQQTQTHTNSTFDTANRCNRHTKDTPNKSTSQHTNVQKLGVEKTLGRESTMSVLGKVRT